MDSREVERAGGAGNRRANADLVGGMDRGSGVERREDERACDANEGSGRRSKAAAKGNARERANNGRVRTDNGRGRANNQHGGLAHGALGALTTAAVQLTGYFVLLTNDAVVSEMRAAWETSGTASSAADGIRLADAGRAQAGDAATAAGDGLTSADGGKVPAGEWVALTSDGATSAGGRIGSAAAGTR